MHRTLWADIQREQGKELGPSLPPTQAHLAQTYGCKGLLIYSDPQDYAPASTTVYPDGPSLPEFGLQRGSLQVFEGDILTPGVPAICK